MGISDNKDKSPQVIKKPSRDEEAHDELTEHVEALNKEHVSADTSKEGSKKRDGRDRGGEEEKDAAYDSSFPGEMNCITAFDEMYYCYSLGGQFMNVYRYGKLRDCSPKSQDWRFCMRAKMYGPVTQKTMIMARNKEKVVKYRTGASSENIWKIRKVPLEEAFQGIPPDMEDQKNEAQT